MGLLNLSDLDILTLNILMEARGEIPDGRAAVGRVMKNRVLKKYESHGDYESALMWHAAFSWTEYDMWPPHAPKQKYIYVYDTPEKQISHILDCYKKGVLNPSWASCRNVAQEVLNGTYHSPAYDRLDDDVVLYYAPSSCHAPKWADPDKLVAVIGRQWFFHA